MQVAVDVDGIVACDKRYAMNEGELSLYTIWHCLWFEVDPTDHPQYLTVPTAYAETISMARSSSSIPPDMIKFQIILIAMNNLEIVHLKRINGELHIFIDEKRGEEIEKAILRKISRKADLHKSSPFSFSHATATTVGMFQASEGQPLTAAASPPLTAKITENGHSSASRSIGPGQIPISDRMAQFHSQMVTRYFQESWKRESRVATKHYYMDE